MQTAKGSALVGGVAMATSTETLAVCATRSFMHSGAAVPVGATLSLPAPLARELIAMGKAVHAPAPVVVQEVPDSLAPEPETDEPRRRGRPPKQRDQI